MDIVKNYNTYLNWVDITEDFINASNGNFSFFILKIIFMFELV